MSITEEITKELLGVPLSRLRDGANLEADIDRCEMKLNNANSFERLLREFAKRDILVENLEIVYALLRLGTRFSNASLVGKEYWSQLMVS